LHFFLVERSSEENVSDDDAMTKFGNANFFSFAGHDTTGNTMTWFVYEVAKRPDVAARLQAEADAFFAAVAGREMQYRDCRLLPFLTRCITETMRLWPVVPWGSFRELQFDDLVTGAGGEQVKLLKGTFVQITTWSRHRNTRLWGDDAAVFNPDREFTADELWNGDPFMAYNPSSDRYSPFTYAPRDCIGKNFVSRPSHRCSIIDDTCFRG